MASRRFNAQNFVTIASVAVLVGLEIIAAAVAAGYAFGTLIDLGHEFTYGLAALTTLVGFWAVWKFVVLANTVEPIYEKEAD